MKLSELICREAVVPSLAAQDRDSIVSELVEAIVAAGKLPAEAAEPLVLAIIDREKKGSTGFGKGVAVPHAKHALVPEMVAAVGLSDAGIDFNSLDGRPVHSVVLLLSPADRSQDHLDAMQAIFKTLQQDAFRRQLRQADSAKAVLGLLREADLALR